MRRLDLLRAVLVVGFLPMGGCSDRPIVVRTVSDRTGLGMAEIRVQVADQPWATTDADGKATFAAVSGTFTVRVHQSITYVPYPEDWILVVEGSSGSEVVVEVDGNFGLLSPPHLPPWYDAEVSGSVVGWTQPTSASTWVQVSYSGSWLTSYVANDGSFDLSFPFQAPATSVTLRAYEGDPRDPYQLTRLFAYGSATVPVVKGGHTTGPSVSLQPVVMGTVEGTASVAAPLAGAEVRGWCSIGFGRYEPAAVFFAETTVTPAGFSLPVASIQGGETSVTLLTTRGGGRGSARQRRSVSVPATGVAFQLPAPAELLEPADAAFVDSTTVFRWNVSDTGGTSTLGLWCDWTADSIPHSVGYSVSTTGSQATLPAIPGVAVPAGASCSWSVGWHAATSGEDRSSSSAGRTATAR
jgi:hypothetical protein